MSFQTRLPAGLEALARLKAGQADIRLNALICIALEAYLKSGATPSMADLGPQPADRSVIRKPRVEVVQDNSPAPTASSWRGARFNEMVSRRQSSGTDSWLAP
jgi:hypothetical protein